MSVTAVSDGKTHSNDLTYSNGLLSPEEAAARLRCSAYTLARWRLEGRGPKWCRIGPKRVAYAIGDINAFMAKES
jgi:predicted DNA-binding transcriptional regulator AlpA